MSQAVNNLGCSVWFSSEDCLQVKVKDKRFIYVFDDFAGDAFQHLVSLGCRFVLLLVFLASTALLKC